MGLTNFFKYGSHRRVRTFGFGRRSRRSFGHGYEPARSCRYELAIFRRCGFRPRQWLCCFRLSGSSRFSQIFWAKSRHGQPLSLGTDCLLLCRGGGGRTSHTRAKDNTASDSGSTGPGKAPAWAKASNKKPTVATLAGQLDVVSNSLPVITEQLTQLTLRQDALEKQVGSQRTDVPAFQPLGRGKSSMPISSLLLVVHLIPAPFSFLPAFFLVVVHLRRQFLLCFLLLGCGSP